MPISAEARAEAERLFAAFVAAGAQPIEADILQPAETLLDLYGEDIRARAYVTWDPAQGEMMLRPDFTVPVVRAHMTNGAEPARYCYRGEVFRQQDRGSGRAAEYLQVGYELFARDDPAAADAEVFALVDRLLAPLSLRATVGDMGLLSAAVRGLHTTDRRKAALSRHIWRPRRFRALLDRYSGCAPSPPSRRRLLARLAAETPETMIAVAGPVIGLRSEEEIVARVRALAEDASAPPISEREADLIDELLRVSAPAPAALERLRDLAVDMVSIRDAVDRLDARLEALARAGVDPKRLVFEASLGRATMEYYDGFVFAFEALGRSGLPPVASGGRYDALTRVLGQGRAIPAVGGVIRPGLVARLKAEDRA
ncbi:MAG: ATP phosphoribosyltransferase regulatory subunit [Gemmobacter sp.]